jgi:hypothetical protein
MVLIEFFIIGFAVWRIALMLVDDIGPFDVFYRLRYWAGLREADDGTKYVQLKSYSRPFYVNLSETLAEGLNCVRCTSMWVALPFFVLYLVSPLITVYVAMPFFLSGVAVLMERIRDG